MREGEKGGLTCQSGTEHGNAQPTETGRSIIHPGPSDSTLMQERRADKLSRLRDTVFANRAHSANRHS